ncbi:hypothetical protein GCM10022284_04090 [Streptomyces hundungensis]
MSEFSRTLVISRSVRTMCQCGEGVSIECTPDDSIAFALGLTDKPTESIAWTALAIWEATHECAPTIDELVEFIGLA